MIRRPGCFRLWMLALPVSLAAAPCFAQSGGLFGSRGPQSSTSAGGVRSSQGNYTGFNTSTLNGFGSTPGFGAGGFGQTGQGGQGGQNGLNFSQTGFGQQMGAGGTSRTSGLSGGLNGAGRTSALGQQTGVGGGGLGNRGLGQGGQLGQRNALGGRGGNQRNRNGLNGQNLGAGEDQQMPVRIRPQVNFQFPARPVAQVNGAIETRFASLSQRGAAFRSVQFELGEAGEVTLRGTVPSEESKRLAAAMIRLEPGVRSINNELTVDAPSAIGN